MGRYPYLYHIGEFQRYDKNDDEEKDGDGGKTETMYVRMYVCIYEWMDVFV